MFPEKFQPKNQWKQKIEQAVVEGSWSIISQIFCSFWVFGEEAMFFSAVFNLGSDLLMFSN